MNQGGIFGGIQSLNPMILPTDLTEPPIASNSNLDSSSRNRDGSTYRDLVTGKMKIKVIFTPQKVSNINSSADITEPSEIPR